MTIRGQMQESSARARDVSVEDGMQGTYHFGSASASIGADRNGPHVLVRSETSPEMRVVIPIGSRGEKDVAELVETINETGRVQVMGTMRDGQLVAGFAVAGNLRLVDVDTRSTGPDDVLDLATGRYMTADRSTSR